MNCEDRSERDERIAKLSKRYVETLDFPRQADLLAREFDYSRLSIPKVIAEARRRGFLTPTIKGRPGGQLTAKTLAILNEQPRVEPGGTTLPMKRGKRPSTASRHQPLSLTAKRPTTRRPDQDGTQSSKAKAG